MRRLTLILLLLLSAGFPAVAPAATSVSRAADYLVARQTSDGCLGDRTGTGWGAIALRAANRRTAARRAATCLARQSAALRTATDRELGIMAAVAGGLNPRRFGGRDLVGLLERSRHGGYYGKGTATNSSIFGVIALKTAKRPIPKAVVRQILRDQAAGGGFDYFPEGQQADMTAAGIQALRAAGYSCRTKAVRRALTALDRFRSGDGYVLGIGQKAERAVDRLGDPGEAHLRPRRQPLAGVAAGATDRRRLGPLRAVRGGPDLGHRPGAAGAREAALADSLSR